MRLWPQDELAKSLKERLHMPVAETLHLAHVLTQAVKGLLAGGKEGIFASDHGRGGVRYWVARLEFQDGKRKRGVHRDPRFYHGRGTPHVHVLLWLDQVQHAEIASNIRADLPHPDDAEMLDLVLGSQLDWHSSGWPVREKPTHVTSTGTIQLHHPRNAFEKCCRAYLPDVLAALRCHVDVLASDGRAMVLKYCASSLAKAQQRYCVHVANIRPYNRSTSALFFQQLENLPTQELICSKSVHEHDLQAIFRNSAAPLRRNC